MAGVCETGYNDYSPLSLVFRFRSSLVGYEDVSGIFPVDHLHQTAEDRSVGTAVLYIVVCYVQMNHLVQNHILDFAFRQFISDVDPQFQLRVPNNQSILVFDG